MRIIVNGAPKDTTCKTLRELHDTMFPDQDIVILNGYQMNDAELHSDDQIYIGKKNEFPGGNDLEMLMSARHTPFVHERMRNATVGIAGLGGLGSNIAAMLARLAVGHLVIADFDIVDPTNLNRQNYFVSDIGMKKTDASEEILHHINPFIEIEKHTVRLDETSIPDIFGRCEVVCEALDSASEKAMFINTLLEKCPDVIVISGSGLGGYDDSNLIRTEKKIRNLYICGDMVSEAGVGTGLMSPRVNICAGHMANETLRVLMGKEK
jgi:sulfur carrier protein ThiS adenylyltransferase